MKRLLLLLGIVCSNTMAQRPTYAGSSAVGIPNVANRFANTSEASASSAPGSPGVDLPNRLGEDTSTTRIPTDARGDEDLVKRIETWPRENQPFWYINADHIEKHRNTQDSVNRQGSGVGTNDRNNAPNTGEPSRGATQNNVNNLGESPNGGPSLNNRNNFGQTQPPRNGGFSGAQPNAGNSFNVFSGNQVKTYVYDPVSDAWYLRRS